MLLQCGERGVGGRGDLFPLGATLKDEAQFLELSRATSTHLAVASPHTLCVHPARQTGVAGILHGYLPCAVSRTRLSVSRSLFDTSQKDRCNAQEGRQHQPRPTHASKPTQTRVPLPCLSAGHATDVRHYQAMQERVITEQCPVTRLNLRSSSRRCSHSVCRLRGEAGSGVASGLSASKATRRSLCPLSSLFLSN
jgi:hypothetical protein